MISKKNIISIIKKYLFEFLLISSFSYLALPFLTIYNLIIISIFSLTYYLFFSKAIKYIRIKNISLYKYVSIILFFCALIISPFVTSSKYVYILISDSYIYDDIHRITLDDESVDILCLNSIRKFPGNFLAKHFNNKYISISEKSILGKKYLILPLKEKLEHLNVGVDKYVFSRELYVPLASNLIINLGFDLIQSDKVSNDNSNFEWGLGFEYRGGSIVDMLSSLETDKIPWEAVAFENLNYEHAKYVVNLDMAIRNLSHGQINRGIKYAKLASKLVPSPTEQLRINVLLAHMAGSYLEGNLGVYHTLSRYNNSYNFIFDSNGNIKEDIKDNRSILLWGMRNIYNYYDYSSFRFLGWRYGERIYRLKTELGIIEQNNLEDFKEFLNIKKENNTDKFIKRMEQFILKNNNNEYEICYFDELKSKTKNMKFNEYVELIRKNKSKDESIYKFMVFSRIEGLKDSYAELFMPPYNIEKIYEKFYSIRDYLISESTFFIDICSKDDCLTDYLDDAILVNFISTLFSRIDYEGIDWSSQNDIVNNVYNIMEEYVNLTYNNDTKDSNTLQYLHNFVELMERKSSHITNDINDINLLYELSEIVLKTELLKYSIADDEFTKFKERLFNISQDYIKKHDSFDRFYPIANFFALSIFMEKNKNKEVVFENNNIDFFIKDFGGDGDYYIPAIYMILMIDHKNGKKYRHEYLENIFYRYIGVKFSDIYNSKINFQNNDMPENEDEKGYRILPNF